ncbi:hypothetical protein [Fibrella aquatica]|uniref:hypothetical protein n=1 Tax=Fibrella aquatica TaxID=3242487 RepID=UPI003520DB4B
MTPTNETQNPRHLLLRIGYEGGSVILYAQSLESLAPVWRESNEMSFDDNDDEIWVESRIEYVDFNAYLQEFTDRELWFYGKPMLIHPVIRPHFQQSLDQVRSQSRRPDSAKYVARWQKALDSNDEFDGEAF